MRACEVAQASIPTRHGGTAQRKPANGVISGCGERAPGHQHQRHALKNRLHNVETDCFDCLYDWLL